MEIKIGYNSITKRSESLPNPTYMDFGVLKLVKNMKYELTEKLEKAILILTGKVKLTWENPTNNSKSIEFNRRNIFDENPWCLVVPRSYSILIQNMDEDSEIIIIQTENEKEFTPRFYKPQDCRSELRGKGTMKETSTRIVRTVFDQTNFPESN